MTILGEKLAFALERLWGWPTKLAKRAFPNFWARSASPDIMDGVALFYNQDEAEFAAKAVNEHAALVAVAEAAEAHQNAKPGQELKLWANIQKALAALAAVREIK